jgi:hypothetical protein
MNNKIPSSFSKQIENIKKKLSILTAKKKNSYKNTLGCVWELRINNKNLNTY